MSGRYDFEQRKMDHLEEFLEKLIEEKNRLDDGKSSKEDFIKNVQHQINEYSCILSWGQDEDEEGDW